MKISYNWLQTLIQTDLSLDELCHELTMSGLEVEHVVKQESIKGGLRGLVVGEVLEKSKHPNADKLSLTKVNIGNGEALPIVCGAPNIAAGQKVVVAPVGTTIYPNSGEAFKIKKAKIRGEESKGMICAEDEIGLGSSHDGVIVLDSHLKVGTKLEDLYEIDIDHEIEIAIIPNRGDAISHLGVAREIQAITGKKYRKPGTVTFDARGPERVDIEIKDAEACPRYEGISLINVHVEPSPDWLTQRLLSIGLNPINNVVDITNYIQHEIGQPIHAFDLDEIEGKQVVVRRAEKGEKLTTLDGEERELGTDNLVIANAENPMALAGVLGGLDSGVTEKTRKVFIESAYFNPSIVRQTAKQFGINSDASYRYERGTDPNITDYALRRVVNLLQDIAQAEVASEIVDIYPNPIADKEIEINLAHLNKFMGHEIEKEKVIEILQNLEIKIAGNNGDNLMLHVPPYRPDVQRPVDIYEEIIRVYGFDNIPIPSKVNYAPSVISSHSENRIQTMVSNYLSANGFQEIMSNSLTNSEYYDDDSRSRAVEMLNPLSREMDVMRMELLNSALESIAYNVNRKNPDLKFYEFGKTYGTSSEGYYEQKVLQISANGRLFKEHWNTGNENMTEAQLKGIAENILGKLNIATKHYKKIIRVEQISSSDLKRHGLKENPISLKIDWQKALELSSHEIVLEDIPKYPLVRRDLSLVFASHIEFKDIKSLAEQKSKGLLRKVELFDVYEGKPLAKGERSLSLAFYLYNPKKTMEDEEIDGVMNALIAGFESQLEAKIRR